MREFISLFLADTPGGHGSITIVLVPYRYLTFYSIEWIS